MICLTEYGQTNIKHQRKTLENRKNQEQNNKVRKITVDARCKLFTHLQLILNPETSE